MQKNSGDIVGLGLEHVADVYVVDLVVSVLAMLWLMNFDKLGSTDFDVGNVDPVLGH
ncbi:hypothetical protein PMAC_002145 [Pneumocystis sp. 'macacae']|nr:hypothetical protein PMAC_002145 [Pneumocystis sp. 'macacae']